MRTDWIITALLNLSLLRAGDWYYYHQAWIISLIQAQLLLTIILSSDVSVFISRLALNLIMTSISHANQTINPNGLATDWPELWTDNAPNGAKLTPTLGLKMEQKETSLDGNRAGCWGQMSVRHIKIAFLARWHVVVREGWLRLITWNNSSAINLRKYDKELRNESICFRQGH